MSDAPPRGATTPPTPHCSDAELNDWLDDRLDAAARGRVGRHCAACAACAGRRDALAGVLAAARTLPTAVEPPDADALLRAIAARVGGAAWAPPPAASDAAERAAAPGTARQAWRLGSAATRPAPRRPAGGAAPRPWPAGRPWATRAAAVAAAGLLAVLGAGAAAWLAGPRPTDAGVAAVAVAPGGGAPAGAPGTGGAARGPDVTAGAAPRAPERAGDPDASRGAALRQEGDRALAPLRAAADGGDRVLAAAALRSLEPSLATVDAAIAEAEAALARDPGDATLASHVARAHERRRELVRRGAFLGSRT
jgi:hypothetical protein